MNQPKSIGRYEIIRVLGYGAVGVVYLARDPLIDREVAVKTLRSDLHEQVTEEYRQRFLREARAAGRLSHPTIVTIYDVGVDHEDGSAFIAMEYLEGQTLKEVMAGGVRYEAERAAHLGAILAEALDHAHQKGVVHRDVKPANVILTTDGKVKITDFGIARVDTSDLTVEGSLIGTPNYMSPEQVRGERADERSDLYSLGVLLFELVTGKRPFPAKSLAELSLNITTEPVPDPASLCPDVPQSLSAIIMRCLAKEPADRFQTGADLAHSLRDNEGVEQSSQAEPRQGEPLEPAPAVIEEADAPPAPDLMATRVKQASAAPTGSSKNRLLRRWTVAAAPALRARWFWPAVLSVALLVAAAVLLHVAGRAEQSGERATSARSSGAAGGGIDSGPGANTQGTGHQPQAAPSTPESTLVVSHRNRLSLAFISLRVDGTKVWTQKMTAEKNVLKRLKRISGVQVQQSLPVSAGTHTIGVHISGKSKDVDADASIQGVFRAGETKRLKVMLNPFSEKLKLEWADS